ncbi:MAG: hypothetical protein A2583_05615 [Bdellovibrionales bacterium RIFOXYD1_FULL_53_11]|nr:MAG: hypothetical protein A2583_05615 [Bdellovibrionales bacterium RIFOXYD1_FULL_53_11]
MFKRELRIGLPHTNYNQLAEHLLMKCVGAFHWDAIAEVMGIPLSKARTVDGREIYATFFYIETLFPSERPACGFKLDDDVEFFGVLRAFKNMSVEGQWVFDHKGSIEQLLLESGDVIDEDIRRRHPFIRFGNVFISLRGSNSNLKVSPPANASFTGFKKLPNEENPYQLVRDAGAKGTFGLFSAVEVWKRIDSGASYNMMYEISPDRDSNGAGLVYFANYFAFMDSAERKALEKISGKRCFTRSEINGRTLRERRMGYFGNADLTDSIRIEVDCYSCEEDSGLLGLRYRIFRVSDGMLICLSEAIKTLGSRENT